MSHHTGVKRGGAVSMVIKRGLVIYGQTQGREEEGKGGGKGGGAHMVLNHTYPELSVTITTTTTTFTSYNKMMEQN